METKVCKHIKIENLNLERKAIEYKIINCKCSTKKQRKTQLFMEQNKNFQGIYKKQNATVCYMKCCTTQSNVTL